MFAHSFRRTPILLNLLAILVLTTSGTISAQPASGIDVAQAATRVSDAPFRSSPVMFIENTGQWDERTRFQVRGAPAGTMWLAEDAMWITVVERPAEDGARSRLDRLGRLNPERANVQPANVQREAVNIKLSFVGANPHPRLEQFDRLDTVVSYFLGNESEKWRPDVPVWGGVRYVNLYPGVDLEITSEDGRIVQRLAARPDADLNAVRLQVEGADAVALDGDTLRLSTSAGEAILPLLLAAGSSGEAEVQPRGAQAFDVASPFMPTGVNPQFAIANPQSPADNLADLLYGTYLGGSSPEQSNHHGIAVDGAGSAYVTSWTDSPDFPSTPGAFDPSENGGADALVVKLNPAGGGLAYATFLGGSLVGWWCQHRRGRGRQRLRDRLDRLKQLPHYDGRL